MRGEKRKWAKIIREAAKSDEEGVDDKTTAASNHQYNRERMLLLRVDDVGHGGNSGQYYGLEDLAFEYAFLIHSLDAPTKPFYPGISNPSYSSHASPISTPFSNNNNWTYNNNWGLTPQPGAFVDFDMGDAGEHSRYPTGSSENSLSDSESNRNITGASGGGGKPKRRTKEDVEERRYRSKTKGDRSQNKIFQWVANFF